MDNSNDFETLEEWKKLNNQEELRKVDIKTVAKWTEHPKKEYFINWKNDSFALGRTMLLSAIKYKRFDIVKLLLEHGADINIGNKYGLTAFILASFYGHINTVELMWEKGANLNITDNTGATALMWASDKGHKKTVELLLDKGADCNIAREDGETALIWASRQGHSTIVKLLAEKGADIAMVDTDGWTALMYASQDGYTDTAEVLVDNGADIKIADKNGTTPLMLASTEGHTDTVKLLLCKGANIKIANKHGDTALMKASRGGHSGTVELLLVNGADCKVTNNQGRNLFTEAYYQGKMNIVDLLLEKALKDIIHDVVEYSHFADKFLELYQENREIVNWLDEDGRTVRQVACKECREVILFLRRYDMHDKPFYESPTCKIYNAIDYGHRDGPNLTQPRHVVMKFMEKKEHFLNEIRTRRKYDGSPRFSSEFVTPDLAAYRADEDPEYAKACSTWKGSENDALPGYCIVMELGERSLLEAMNAENLSAEHKDLRRREILLVLCKIFSYVHGMGYIHGDIKPHNVVRHNDPTGTWKAIDFDACTKVGDVVGLKLTTGSAPPEMLKIIKEKDDTDTESMMAGSQVVLRQPQGGLDDSDLVLADPSFDVWSYGILMYQLVTGRSFFHCDFQGNVDNAGILELANLTEGRIHEKLASVKDVNARVLLSRILRLNPKERPTMSDIGQDYYFHPSESPQGRKAEFFGKQVFSIFVPQVLDAEIEEKDSSAFETNQISRVENDDDDGVDNMEDIESLLSSKADFSYLKLRDEDKDWNDKLLNSEVETFHFDTLEGMGEKPKFVDGDTIYGNYFLRSLLSRKGPDYFMGFLVEFFELYKIMDDAHEVCQGIKVNLVSDVKSLKGIFIKLFVRGKGLNDVVRGTLFCNSIDQFKYVGRQLKERYGHNVYTKPPKREAGAWPIPKLLIYGNRRFHGRCLSVEIQFSTVYMHLATHASINHLVYEAIRESTGYLGDKDKDFQEFLQSLNEHYIDTEGFLRNQNAQNGRFEIVVEPADENNNDNVERSGKAINEQYTKATGFTLSGRICCGALKFHFMSPTDRFQRFSESSFVVNKSLTLLSSHSYWSDEPYDLEGKTVEYIVSFKGRGLAIAGISTAKCLHGATESDCGGSRCSLHVGRSKFVIRRSGVEEVFREKKLPNQERAKILFKMEDGLLSVSFVGSNKEYTEEVLDIVQVIIPSDKRYYLYMRAPPGVHDVKFHEVNIR